MGCKRIQSETMKGKYRKVRKLLLNAIRDEKRAIAYYTKVLKTTSFGFNSIKEILGDEKDHKRKLEALIVVIDEKIKSP